MNRTLLLLVVTAFGAAFPAADDPRAIMTEVQKRSRAESQQYEGVLTVIDPGGKSSEKSWTYQRLGSHGASKVIIRFTRPAEVKGVALLVMNNPDRASDQWMWTPAINRERRIAAQDRRTRFFGTDFSFEDLEERDVEQYDYSLEGDEPLNGEPCWKIVATPRAAKRSQYSKSVYWVRKATYTYAQIENFSESGLVRRLKYKDLEQIDGIWTAKTLEVDDVVRKSRTILTLQSTRYNLPLAADQFTLQALRRS
jgi:outer membrane lipoprotein-sorting protein